MGHPPTIEILDSLSKIKRAIDPSLLDYLRTNDPAKYRQPKSVSRRILNDYDSRCVICGRNTDEVNVWVAHIKPVEEGGRSDDLSNLIPLCDSKIPPLGCHQLYDGGCLSRVDLRNHILGGSINPALRRKMNRLHKRRGKIRLGPRPLPIEAETPATDGIIYLKGRTVAIDSLKSALRKAKEEKNGKKVT